MSPEEALIGIVRNACGFKSGAAIFAVDRHKVLELAKRQAVLPLLSELDAAERVDSMTDRLGNAEWHSVYQVIQAKRLLRSIQAAFAAVGVRALLCKGIALKEWAYNGVSRSIGDVDIIVDPKLYPRAQQVLHQLQLSPIREGALSDAHATNWHTLDGQVVDLQTSLLEPYFLTAPSFEELWQRRVIIPSIDMPVLHPVDHVLFLLLHGLKHQWCRLSWILDVAMAAKKLNVTDWDELHRRVQRLSVKRPVNIGLLLCRAVLDPTEIDWQRAIMRPSRLEQVLAVRYQRRLFREIPNTIPQKIRNSMLHAFACERARHVVKYIRGRIGNMTRFKSSQPGVPRESIQEDSPQHPELSPF
jgi:hypothetical protein